MDIRILALPFIIVFIISCNTEIETPNYEKHLIIDGYIINQEFPVVFLTSNLPFYDNLDSLEFYNSIIKNAWVKVYSDSISEILTLKKNSKSPIPYYYEGSELKGEVGKDYYLEVISGGKVFTATTTIPNIPDISTIETVKINTEENSYGVKVKINDKNETTNYYRATYRYYLTSIFIYPFHLNSFSNKQIYPLDLVLFKDIESSILSNTEPITYFKEGENIEVLISLTTEDAFSFWNDLQKNNLGISIIGGSYQNSVGNIENGVGIWCGYGTRKVKIAF